ncbi:hypothetical protein AVEN_193397-1 [Araneus ventricosus]|uniref:Uncharacterized protein n=1 Tax=Araneus ventricosus TaxID=182803 RepID=A0A4Y2F9B5_ARAVE|nr:hypothetical protein AVEN_193397-1 [Araneus ventricosus]
MIGRNGTSAREPAAGEGFVKEYQLNPSRKSDQARCHTETCTFKPPSPGLEHVDVINEDLNDITEQELEQQEVQNLLTTPEPVHDGLFISS